VLGVALGCLALAGLIYAFQGTLGIERGPQGPPVPLRWLAGGAVAALVGWGVFVAWRSRRVSLGRLVALGPVGVTPVVFILLGRALGHGGTQVQANVAYWTWLAGSLALAAFLLSLFVLPGSGGTPARDG
jgi:hypothetical protein